MKKLISILFAVLILVSGLHLTVASHICCGELAGVKYSFTGEKAGCGMTEEEIPATENGAVKGVCCINHVSQCCADNSYFAASSAVKKITTEVNTVCDLLPQYSAPSPLLPRTSQSMLGPPVPKLLHEVDLSFICVLII